MHVDVLTLLDGGTPGVDDRPLMQMNRAIGTVAELHLHLVTPKVRNDAPRPVRLPAKLRFELRGKRIDDGLHDRIGIWRHGGQRSGGRCRRRRSRWNGRGSCLSNRCEPTRGEKGEREATDKSRFHIASTQPQQDVVPIVRLASTVMLVRPSHQGPCYEVFMLRRSSESAFAPDAFVFPGGTVDEADMSAAMLRRAVGIQRLRLADMFKAKSSPLLESRVEAVPEQQRAGLLIAALRELYEEAGVLLAVNGADLRKPASFYMENTASIQDGRQRVTRGVRKFWEILEELDAYADATALTLFSQWITPPSEPRRYNAHFFLAVAPPEQPALADAFETHDGLWIQPKIALERKTAGTFTMIYPTLKHIERLARFDTIEHLMHFAQSKNIVTIMPLRSHADGFTLPEELEFAW